MKIDAQAIKAQYDVAAVFMKDGHKLIRKGPDFSVCLCPFHREKSPSCAVYSDHFYCFGCHASGDVIGYVMLRDNIKFKEAIEKLSGGNSVTIQAQQWKPLPAPRETPPLAGAELMIEQWKTETDIDDLDLMAFELGVSLSSLISIECVWASKHNAWAFPMRDRNMHTVGIRLRDKSGKKWAVKGSKEGLFYGSITSGRTTWICEGPTDACAGMTLDLNIIGRPSCQGAVKELVGFLENLRPKEVIIISDNDAPGLAGTERLQNHLTMETKEIVLPCKDLREFVKLGGTRRLLESMAAKQLPQRRQTP